MDEAVVEVGVLNVESNNKRNMPNNDNTDCDIDCNIIKQGDTIDMDKEKDESSTDSGAGTSNSSFEVIVQDKQTESDEMIKENLSTSSNNSQVTITNSSLCNLLVYSSGESENDDDDNNEDVCGVEESDESDSYECISDEQQNGVKTPTTTASQPTKKKTKEDPLTDTLKSISNLQIHVKEEECDEIGKISSIIDKLVMVESIPNKPAYDVDTLLFLDNGKQPLGFIFDVIGAVTCPMYAIRFNSTQEIAALNITKGMPVFSAPKSEHTQYVFVQQLLQSKGSDASWKNDMEVPQAYQDYSDDEAEGNQRQQRRFNTDNRKRNSLERYQNFEKDMNVKNVIDTRLHKIRDNFEPMNKKQTPNSNYNKRGYQFYSNYRPSFGFTQATAAAANTSSTSCAFPPSFGIPPFMPSNMPMPPYAPQSMPTFIPSLPPAPLPPNYRLPAPMPNLPPHFAQLQQQPQPQPPPPSFQPHDVVNVNGMYTQLPNTSQQAKNTPSMVYPPDMGLPRPPTQNPYVPNQTMPYFDPRVQQMWHYHNTTTATATPNPARQQQYPKAPRNYHPKRQ